MIKGSHIDNLPIFDKINGNKIALAKGKIFSKESNELLAILVSEKSYFKDAKIIRFENINKIGRDFIYVENSNVIENAKDYPEIMEAIDENDNVIGEEVLTEDGESLGIVLDVVIDELSGEVKGFILTDGLIEDIVNGRNIIPYADNIKLGENSIVIEGKITDNIVKNKEDYNNLLG
ncbi:PRC-barrel domain-containing protein [Thermohalobacter berrensis]|uniref:PRC-barrel domain-containing protein n=1 Tax=Thermohalobacter berrensis TaxID=99594 RepID=A0A419TAV9_9FIRM|nr:PRC-barrel domain-containing protein [Thermohalobacter berrensis]RKD34618.1 hypothetical protein BET03_01985 [Thermohalobacter berrensis]